MKQPFGKLLLVLFIANSASGDELPDKLKAWLRPQSWERNDNRPVISLGGDGQFDDTHIFAPAVIRENDRYLMWYCGSRGSVNERLFRLGLATSDSGKTFARYKENPVFEFGDGRHSVLTPTFLRSPDGEVLREDGRLRMWFSSTAFQDGSNLHTLHEANSETGISWSQPSDVLLQHVYAPTIIRDGREYRMWYVDVKESPWIIRHAISRDGRRWRVSPEPCLVIDQDWENKRLFYPTVLKVDGVYLMWYGSYWKQRASTTATGFAVSLNGLKWYKHPDNPVLRPDPRREWESHYVTSQSVLRLPDGAFRIWYASRRRPPFVNKYFALNTAVWQPSASPSPPRTDASVSAAAGGPDEFRLWRDQQRSRLREMLGIPKQRVPLDAERRGQVELDDIVIEKWVFTSEPGSKVPAVLYRPKHPPQKMPAIVLSFGHGGSKSQWQYNYAGMVYAKLGLACLAMDPLGEEERHRHGQLGTREHDPKSVSDRADQAGRLIMGKLVFDTMRGIDFLLERDDIDSDHVGVAGNSLGGAKAGWMAALEPRIRMAIVSGWAYDDITLRSKYCTRLPNERMRERLSWTDYALLAAPDCAVLLMNGDADWVIDKGYRSVWERTRRVVSDASQVYEQLGSRPGIQAWFESGGGHRPYFVYKDSLEWIHQHLTTPAMTLQQIRELPELVAGEWCDLHGVGLEELYGTPLHQRGAVLPDFGLHPVPRESLSCLNANEVGSLAFTVEGWLKQIELHRTGESTFSIASVLTDKRAFDRPHDVELRGNLAFIPGKGGSLAIVDVREPTSPQLLWHRHDPDQLDDAETVLPIGDDRLFMGTNDLHSIDVADPRNPVFLARISDRTRITRINGMVNRDHWILAASKHGWLDAFDIRNPSKPLLQGAANVRVRFGIHSPHDVDVYADYVVVANPHGFDRSNKPGGLAVLKIFDDSTHDLLPAEQWEQVGVVVSPDLAGANRVQVSGRHAFVGASTSGDGGRLVAIDLSDPTSPRQVAAISFATDDGWGPNGLTIAGRVVFLAGGQSVEAIDISDPRQPTRLAQQRFLKELANAHPRYKGGSDSGHDLVYRDGYLYVTGQNDNCLMILRVESKRIRELADGGSD